MNIIKINFSQATKIIIGHNLQVLDTITTPGIYELQVTTVNGANKFWMHNIGQLANIEWITMYDLGQDKLVYLGNCYNEEENYQSQEIPNNFKWAIEYQYPVFPWVYQALCSGWLIGP
jgi:hypothetical protein